MRTVCHWARQERVIARMVSGWQRQETVGTSGNDNSKTCWENKSIKELEKS